MRLQEHVSADKAQKPELVRKLSTKKTAEEFFCCHQYARATDRFASGLVLPVRKSDICSDSG